MISEEQLGKEIGLIIENGIREDQGDGDHSSLACIPEDAIGRAKLLVKEDGILAGVQFAVSVFSYLDRDLQIDIRIGDGAQVQSGDEVFYLHGRARSILLGERLVLNAMQRMSAIATKTRTYVALLEGTGTRLLDTRKTSPGIRALEKWAVKIGGGENHRFALYDMILLKDNHIDYAGGITPAIKRVQTYLKQTGRELDIIVEARDLGEVKEILKNEGVQRILLDNFSLADTRKAVTLIGSRCKTESSGGITLDTIRAYAECGVNYISSGALTHSVSNMDLSLKAF